MKRWSYYDERTGMFSRKKNGTPDSEKPVTPAGYRLIEGDFDPLSQRVDLRTGQVIDWQPPQPDADHDWNPQARRWQKREEILRREATRARAQLQIEEIEKKQARRVRELLAESDPQLKAIDDQIAALRVVLAETETTTR